jgi:hypothetical protein
MNGDTYLSMNPFCDPIGKAPFRCRLDFLLDSLTYTRPERDDTYRYRDIIYVTGIYSLIACTRDRSSLYLCSRGSPAKNVYLILLNRHPKKIAISTGSISWCR